MNIRLPFAAAFFLLLVASAYLGFAKIQNFYINDKALHFIAFFLLTATFYMSIDIPSRRKLLNFTLAIPIGALGVGSEIAQGLLPYRDFSPLDIAANLLGGSCALALCAWYHKRMLEQRRRSRYDRLGQQPDGADGELLPGDDLEMQAGATEGQELSAHRKSDDDSGSWANIDENFDGDVASPPTHGDSRTAGEGSSKTADAGK